MSGFVYIWRDNKRKMFYIGSHLGPTTDKYVCSNLRMINAYKLRPENFKRRILLQMTKCTVRELHLQEQKWLDLIPKEELGNKYYNLKKKASGGNGHANKGNSNIGGWNRGIPNTVEQRKAISNANTGVPKSESHKAKIAMAMLKNRNARKLVE